MSGHYYTIDIKPVSEKVLFEGTDKECYEFVFNEIDAFNFEHKYKPIQKREKIDNGQLELF